MTSLKSGVNIKLWTNTIKIVFILILLKMFGAGNKLQRKKYLKTIYENRVQKKDNTKHATEVGLYTKSYGGQIHFDIFGIDKTRKIIGMSGFAGQQILIDLDNKRIIVVSSLYRNYNWKKIVYSVIKN